jgi:LysR family glycine cleavage system transcriptional activator
VLQTTDSLPIIENLLAGRGMAFVRRTLVKSYLMQEKIIKIPDFTHQTQWALHLVVSTHHFQWLKVKNFVQWIMTKFTSL